MMMSRIVHFGHQGAGLVLVAMILLVSGCGSGNSDSGPDGPLIVPAADTALPKAIVQDGIEFYAMGQANAVRLFVRNLNRDEILVGAKCFGVIMPGARHVEPFQLSRDDHFLPLRSLKEGDSVQGFLRFNTLDNLVGGYLVYVAPDSDLPPVRCRIDADTGMGLADPEAESGEQ